MSVADMQAQQTIVIPGEICRDFERSSRLEWLETNHTGAFAMGTVAGVNTRRYHTLLMASLRPPGARYSLLPRLEERLRIENATFELATVQYPGVVQPHGFDLLEEFRLDPFPIWRYRAGNAQLEKTVCLLDQQQSVLIHYRCSHACDLDIRPLFAFRSDHSLTHRNPAARITAAVSKGALTIQPYDTLPALTLFHCGEFSSDGLWYFQHEYLRELDRGLDFREDLFSPGTVHLRLGPRESAWLLATLEPQRFHLLQASHIESILQAEAKRRRFERSEIFETRLCRALDQFRVRRFDSRHSLIAGYPWFADWSRDTLISLPAFTALGFPTKEIKSILQTLLDQRRCGLLPNRFSDQSAAPEYNSADASLWFFVAADHLLDSTHDRAFLQGVVFPAAEEILAWHFRGTSHSIRVDPADHLLSAGNADTQLTWMDARVSGRPVTPRHGKPVEINALWYNALKIAAKWAAALGQENKQRAYAAEAQTTLASFRQKFWNPAAGCLYDVLGPEKPDARIRPNQLFALALPFPLLEREQARSVVSIVQEKLLTPVGLRTLDPQDPHYCPRYQGPLPQLDAAYHQGTVWPWLIGPFIAAYLYAYGDSDQSIRFCRDIVARFEEQLTACCLGSLSEVYDAEPPHRPGGCPAQLWSVAQIALAWKRLAPIH